MEYSFPSIFWLAKKKAGFFKLLFCTFKIVLKNIKNKNI